MSRPYGYVGRPEGSPATRLTGRGRNVLDACALLGCVLACWVATIMLPHVAHQPTPEPTSTGTSTTAAQDYGHGMFNPDARIDPAQVEHRENETR